MLASPLPPSFLDTYSLSTSLGCKDLHMVISFLVLWPICLSSLLIHFKNRPEYLTRETVQIFILCQSFRYRVLSRVAFWFFWDTIFNFFFHFHHWWCQLPIFPSICRFSFLRAFCLLPDLLVRLLPSYVVCRFSWLSWRIFLRQIPFLHLDCIFSQFLSVFPILFFNFWQTVWYCSYTTRGWSFLAIYLVCIRLYIS